MFGLERSVGGNFPAALCCLSFSGDALPPPCGAHLRNPITLSITITFAACSVSVEQNLTWTKSRISTSHLFASLEWNFNQKPGIMSSVVLHDWRIRPVVSYRLELCRLHSVDEINSKTWFDMSGEECNTLPNHREMGFCTTQSTISSTAVKFKNTTHALSSQTVINRQHTGCWMSTIYFM